MKSGTNLTISLSEGFYTAALRWFTDIDVMQYISFARRTLGFRTIDEVKPFCRELTDAVFFEINADRLIGYTSLSHFGDGKCEFGIIIGEKDYWGKGHGMEASRQTLDYAFSELGMRKVILSTSEYHASAINMYEKLGFRASMIIPAAREIYHEGKWQKSATIIMELARR